MPNRAKGPRLYQKGKGEAARWIIRDGERRIATGCGLGDREQAEGRLADYLAQKHQPERRERRADQVAVADLIAIYLTDIVEKKPQAQASKAAARFVRLLGFFGRDKLNQINGRRCRDYVAARGNDGGARRDLQDLSAAIQHHHREGYHLEHVRVWLPGKGERRDRWLTRSEIARLVWAAWSFRSAMPVPGQYQKGAPPPGIRRPGKHIARAILFAYYTGSRPGDVLRASFHLGAGRSYVDLDQGVLYRKPPGKAETKKRQPPCRLGNRILAHLRRWKERKLVASHVVEFDGGPVLSIKTGLGSAIKRAKLDGALSTYTLRHSRITHQLQQGIDAWEIAGNVGTSPEMIQNVYGHHDPRAQRRAANA